MKRRDFLKLTGPAIIGAVLCKAGLGNVLGKILPDKATVPQALAQGDVAGPSGHVIVGKASWELMLDDDLDALRDVPSRVASPSDVASPRSSGAPYHPSDKTGVGSRFLIVPPGYEDKARQIINSM